VDRILRSGCRPSPRIDKVYAKLAAERSPDRGVGLQAGRLSVLDRMEAADGEAGATSELSKWPAPRAPVLRDVDPEVEGGRR
jgi:hypothetical protein